MAQETELLYTALSKSNENELCRISPIVFTKYRRTLAEMLATLGLGKRNIAKIILSHARPAKKKRVWRSWKEKQQTIKNESANLC